MVVMDPIDGRDAYNQFKGCDLPSIAMNDVKVALEKLTTQGSFLPRAGDARRPNVVVFKSPEKDEEGWHDLYVHFDWSWECRKVPANAEYWICG